MKVNLFYPNTENQMLRIFNKLKKSIDYSIQNATKISLAVV